MFHGRQRPVGSPRLRAASRRYSARHFSFSRSRAAFARRRRCRDASSVGAIARAASNRSHIARKRCVGVRARFIAICRRMLCWKSSSVGRGESFFTLGLLDKTTAVFATKRRHSLGSRGSIQWNLPAFWTPVGCRPQVISAFPAESRTQRRCLGKDTVQEPVGGKQGQ